MIETRILMDDEVAAAIAKGKKVAGYAEFNIVLGLPEFKAFGKGKKRPKDIVIAHLEHGNVRESKEKIKLFLSVDKLLGLSRILSIINRETNEAKGHIVDRAMNNNV